MSAHPSALADLARGGTIEVPVFGSSMVPLIRDGDTVTVAPVDGDLRRGEVVLAMVGRRWVMHRVLRIGDGLVVLRGDNRLHEDAPIRRAAVVGRALAVTRGGRTFGLEWSRRRAELWLTLTPWVARATRLSADLRRLKRRIRPGA